MKKIFAILMIALSIFALASCESSDVPEGMQLVNGGDDKGYYFYAPEEFTVANLADVDAVYVSAVNTTSITFTEISAEEIGAPAASEITIVNDKLTAEENYFLYQYFDARRKDFPEDMMLLSGPTEDIFGAGEERADAAVAYSYTYTYAEVQYGFTQYFALHNGSYYILTYSAIYEVLDGFESSRYDEYREKLEQVVESFRFVNKTGEDKPEESYPSDEYRLVTDRKLAGFEFYAPGDFTVDYASAIVSVTASDGSNVSMTEATAVGTTADEYMKKRFNELSAIVDDIKPAGASVDPENPESFVGVATKLGNNSSWAFAYEYTYTYKGESYHVYQILAVDGVALWADGYVFTYTAKEENYAAHLDKVMAMIEKVVF
ncbi:MAG: hypothetical protein IJ515_00105 [Clostridia bacterium]|nr:hypothetical protein [Clostridia bacterium]